MFEEFKEYYSLQYKNYKEEANILRQDIDYISLHYYRTRLNTKYNFVIVIPSLIDDIKNVLLQDMYIKSIIPWKESLENILELMDIVDAMVSDITKLTTGKRKDLVIKFKELNNTVKELADVDLKNYLSSLFDNNTSLIKEIELLWYST